MSIYLVGVDRAIFCHILKGQRLVAADACFHEVFHEDNYENPCGE